MSKKVQLNIRGMGAIVLELNEQGAPKTVENFLRYVREKYYDGLVFHRVIKGFVIQTGGFAESGGQALIKGPKPPLGEPVMNEADNLFPNHKYGLAAARTSDPHSASSQFFINTANNDFLNHTGRTPQGWGYCVFGKVVSGMEVVDAIEQVPTGRRGVHDNWPKEDVVIESAVELSE
jgi:peptidyl-prolyl cis-trans isomerase B (cyclophilin B)